MTTTRSSGGAGLSGSGNRRGTSSIKALRTVRFGSPGHRRSAGGHGTTRRPGVEIVQISETACGEEGARHVVDRALDPTPLITAGHRDRPRLEAILPPEQALGVFELLDDLRENIWARYCSHTQPVLQEL
jgi:hypothetical protein